MTAEDASAVVGGAGARAAGARPATLRSYAARGDSFTAGPGCGPGEGWADRLAALLAGRSPSFAYRNLAVDGATSADVVEHQLGPALQLEPDLVTVVCGGNDVLFSVRPDVPGYVDRLGVIFGRLRATLPEVAIATATAPERWSFLDLGQRTRERFERGLAELNRATREVASAHGVACLEIAGHPGLAEATNFDADGLHPSTRGHAGTALAFARLLGVAGVADAGEHGGQR